MKHKGKMYQTALIHQRRQREQIRRAYEAHCAKEGKKVTLQAFIRHYVQNH